MNGLRAALFLLLVGAALTGCATSRDRERARVLLPDTSQYTWTGKSVDQVLQVFGRPSSRGPDGAGGTVLSYEEITSVPPNLPNPPTSPDPRVASGAAPPVTVEPSVESKLKAQFWIDAEGKVTRFWFSPGMYRKGIPSPPSGS